MEVTMTNVNECKHTGDITIQEFIHNSGKPNQCNFFIARCKKCKSIISVLPRHSYEQKFQIVLRDLADIKDKLANLESKKD